MKKSSRVLAAFTIAVLSFGLLVSLMTGAVEAAPTFPDTNFQQVWQRADKLLTERTGVGRGYIWGPESLFSGTEPYNEGSGGVRTVQYFDKARMEVNNPNGNRSDPNFVTSGLLVKELVLGRQQNGNDVNNYTQGNPSEVQVAGDPNSGGANANAPVYRSFKNVATFNNDNPANPQLGEVITQSIDKAGTISTITSPDLSVRTSTYESSTRHNIANVFAYYGNQQGLIWNGSSYVNGLLFYPNATYVFGLPITEPYWIRAVVGGVEKDVLVQLFERRVLTYTPSNDLNNRAEMGNVGQHYYRWRYQESLGRGTNNPITATPTNTPPVSNTPIPTLGSTTTPTNTPVPSTTPIVTATSTPTPTPIATSTVAPTVTPTPSDPLPSQWLARFNAYRAAAGLPPVTEDAALSAADAKHVDYMLLNPNEMVHDEDPTHPGYSPEGQQAAKQSNLARGGSNNDPIDMWMSDILHRYGMLKPELISTGYSFKCNAQGCGAALNVIAKTTGTGLPDGVVYPGNGQQSVANLQYITWQFGSFDPVVTLVSASLKDGQGQAVPFTAQPAQGYFNVVALQLQNSLTASTTYTVQFTVSQNGQTKNKTWSFKTL